jgi:hypothetical protein
LGATGNQSILSKFDGTGNVQWTHKLNLENVPYLSVSLFVADSGDITVSRSDGWIVSLRDTLPGDFTGNGVVDAADYVAWRRGLGTPYTQDHYYQWRAHFGEPAGGNAEATGSAAVPEPGALVLLIVGIAAVFNSRRVAVL